jgi:hypothetical protein
VAPTSGDWRQTLLDNATDKNGHARLSSLKFLVIILNVLFFFGNFSYLPIWLDKELNVYQFFRKYATFTVFYEQLTSEKTSHLKVY